MSTKRKAITEVDKLVKWLVRPWEWEDDEIAEVVLNIPKFRKRVKSLLRSVSRASRIYENNVYWGNEEKRGIEFKKKFEIKP
jgi:hypothetical protein